MHNKFQTFHRADHPKQATMVTTKGRFFPFSSRKPWTSTLLFIPILLLFSFIMLILLHRLSLPTVSRDTNKPHDLTSIVHNFVDKRSDVNDDDNGSKTPWIEVISWKPRAVIYHNLLSKDECEHLINLAKPHMKRSTVVDDSTGDSIDSGERTSSGTFLDRGQDETIQDIEKRIADLTFIPVEHGEGLQILHYGIGQKYDPHHDYFLNEMDLSNGGNRVATVLMYLSDVEEGGETVFPNAEGNISSVSWWNELSECGKSGLSIKPKMGDALLFWSMNPDATFDESSLHGGCPVIKGNKWSSTKWLHLDEYKA